MRFVYSSDEHPHVIEGMCRWAGMRIGQTFDPKTANGISVFCENGVATVLYTGYDKGVSILMHVAGEGHWLSRTALRVFFYFPFVELDLRRITTLVARKNRKARTLNEKLGFVQEGCLRHAVPNGDHFIVYGMLKKECRWLKEEDHEEGRRRA